ncbi:hypothetical protein LFM09_46585 [Lentzea alba]|uniref:hypothetical protein n=1 Tax=Lentzea alba TaxID=2714351 RepID=UPI0039BF0D25
MPAASRPCSQRDETGQASCQHQTEQDYFKLYDSWDGIRTWPGLWGCCEPGYHSIMIGGLAKTPTSDRVYIYDVDHQVYRWIVSGEVFNKYGFSWGKIQTLDRLHSGRPDWWR